MTIRELEPFAWGYTHSGTQNREYCIANGMKTFAEVEELTIDPSEWFVGPVRASDRPCVRYSRAGGIVVSREKRDAEIEEHPELEGEIRFLYDYFTPYDTERMIAKFLTPVQEKLEINKCAWSRGGGHSNPDYELLLRVGTNGLREKIALFRKIHTDKAEFYDALTLVLEGLETIAGRYQALAKEMLAGADGEDKKVLERLISAFDNIPRNKPRNFFEACQFFWLAFSFQDIDSPGLFDYALGVYYEDENEEDRYACLEKLWELFKKTRTWNLCVGRSDETGAYHANALTFDVLRVAREKKYNTPNLTMRVNKNTPKEVWRAAMDTLATGIGMPAIYNDDCVCPALEALGIPASDAHLYCMNGCNQFEIFGKSHMGLEDGEISVIKALEFALFDGMCKYSDEYLGLRTGDASKFTSFEELMNAFYRQIDYLCDYITSMANRDQKAYAEYAPNPWKSVFVQGCVEKGLDYNDRGPIYGHGQVLTEGLPDTADSLAAVRHFVFEEKKYTMKELVDALDANFERYEELYEDFKGYHKFGNDLEDVDEIYATITDYIYRKFQTVETFRGGRFGVGCSTFHRAPNYGLHCGAMPNGKKKREQTLADSIGATPGRDKKGPTALLNSVLKGNQYLATSGNVMQVKFAKNQFDTEEGKAAFTALAQTYFRQGGQTLQINVVSREELLDAMKHPENHEDLIVRVGGYSAYFNKLALALKQSVINRTENGL